MPYDIHEEQGYSVVGLTGDIDLSTSPEAREVILSVLNNGKDLLVDLHSVDYMDSSGVATLVEGFQLARGKKLRFGLVGVSDSAMSVLHLARLDTVFPIKASVGDFAAA